MPRFITDFPVNATDETIHYIVNDYLTREGFVYTNYNGEDVWKKGKGLMAAPPVYQGAVSKRPDSSGGVDEICPPARRLLRGNGADRFHGLGHEKRYSKVGSTPSFRRCAKPVLRCRYSHRFKKEKCQAVPLGAAFLCPIFAAPSV